MTKAAYKTTSARTKNYKRETSLASLSANKENLIVREQVKRMYTHQKRNGTPSTSLQHHSVVVTSIQQCVNTSLTMLVEHGRNWLVYLHTFNSEQSALNLQHTFWSNISASYGIGCRNILLGTCASGLFSAISLLPSGHMRTWCLYNVALTS